MAFSPTFAIASPTSPACPVADILTPAIGKRPRQAQHVRLQTHPLRPSKGVPTMPGVSVADPHRKAFPPSPACSVADSSTPAIERRPRQARRVCCRLIHSGYRETSPASPACLLQTHPLWLSRGVPTKPCMSVADSSTLAIERRPHQALHVRLQAPYRKASPTSPACLLQTVVSRRYLGPVL